MKLRDIIPNNPYTLGEAISRLKQTQSASVSFGISNTLDVVLPIYENFKVQWFGLIMRHGVKREDGSTEVMPGTSEAAAFQDEYEKLLDCDIPDFPKISLSAILSLPTERQPPLMSDDFRTLKVLFME